MALFEPVIRGIAESRLRRGHPRVVGHRGRKRFRRARLREDRLGLRRNLRTHAASRPRRGDRAHGHQAGDRVLEVGVGTGINAALYPLTAR